MLSFFFLLLLLLKCLLRESSFDLSSRIWTTEWCTSRARVRDIGYRNASFSLLMVGSDSLTVTLVQVLGCNVLLAFLHIILFRNNILP